MVIFSSCPSYMACYSHKIIKLLRTAACQKKKKAITFLQEKSHIAHPDSNHLFIQLAPLFRLEQRNVRYFIAT